MKAIASARPSPIVSLRRLLFRFAKRMSTCHGLEAHATSANATLIPIHPLIPVHRLVKPADLVAGHHLGTILFVARLEADHRSFVFAGFEEDALKRGVAVGETDETVVAIFRRRR